MTGRTRLTALALGVCSTAALLLPSPATATASGSCHLPRFGPGRDYHPHSQAGASTARVDNPYFPFAPGRTYVYRGTKDGDPALDLVVPTTRTRRIDGVRTRVVEDRLYLHDVLRERTSDYYAQDRCGNGWYFGEDTATLDRKGNVIDTEGSFRAGVDGAQPGVFMQATPEVGRQFRQE